MSKPDRVLQQILNGTSDANVSFSDLCQLLRRLGFDERIRGSHHIFRRSDVNERINLQQDGSKAKPYQVRQVRKILLSHGIGDDE